MGMLQYQLQSFKIQGRREGGWMLVWRFPRIICMFILTSSTWLVMKYDLGVSPYNYRGQWTELQQPEHNRTVGHSGQHTYIPTTLSTGANAGMWFLNNVYCKYISTLRRQTWIHGLKTSLFSRRFMEDVSKDSQNWGVKTFNESFLCFTKIFVYFLQFILLHILLDDDDTRVFCWYDVTVRIPLESSSWLDCSPSL